MSGSSSSPHRGFATRAIHHGYNPFDYHGALNPPVFLTSTYGFESAATGSDRFAGEQEGYVYSRIGNPTVSVLESKLAELEGAEAALATSSGMGALTSVVWSLLKAGDGIVADKTLYGCTFSLLEHQLARFGISTRFADLTDPANLREALSPQTRLVVLETPSNPNMRLVDIAAVAEICRRAGVLLLVDNTYCTPYLQRPIELGADIVVHSATKYLGGHGDLIAGAPETVDRMAGMLERLDADAKVLDIGAGYGGSARRIAKNFGASVRCLNISEIQNDTNRHKSSRQGLAEKVSVVHGVFEDIPEPDGSFDVVWSQDAILHSGNRTRVLDEVKRVLKPGGQFIFTDPMQADDCPEGVLQPILDRIHLETLGSFGFYETELAKRGFEKLEVIDMTHQLRRHYWRVGQELEANYERLTKGASTEYLDNMLKGLGRWVDGADKGWLAWGVMHYRLAK